jgi:methionyl-tRNA formyltransferase
LKKRKMSNHPPLFAFFGTPRFAVEVLNALEAHGLLPALVVTAPDKPRGRGMTLSPSPAKAWAEARNIDVLTPETLTDEALIAELENTPWDLFVVAAYAKLIPASILSIPKHGALNIHPSLLPKFRGPSPALSAILADERVTGVSIMQMNEKMDAGPIIAQAKVELEEAAWPPRGSEFEDMLAREGGNLLGEVMPLWVGGEITPEPQDETLATYTKKFIDSDARINLTGDPRTELLKIRAFDKNPRAYFLTPDQKRVIVTEAEIKDNALHILRVIPEGKKEIAFTEWSGSRG